MDVYTKSILKENGIFETELHIDADVTTYEGYVRGFWRSQPPFIELQQPTFFLHESTLVSGRLSKSGTGSAIVHLLNLDTRESFQAPNATHWEVPLNPGTWQVYFAGDISTGEPTDLTLEISWNANDLMAGLTETDDADADLPKVASGEFFTVRYKGSSRAQVIRVAHEKAAAIAAGRPFQVLKERVWAEANRWVCVLECEILAEAKAADNHCQ